MESATHFILSSEVAVKVWSYSSKYMDQKFNFLTLSHLLTHWWKQVKDKKLAIVIWNVWKSRNKCRFDDIKMQLCNIVRDTISHINRLYKPYNLCLEKDKCSNTLCNLFQLNSMIGSKTDFCLVRWLSPPENLIKLNTDGACHGNPVKLGVEE